MKTKLILVLCVMSLSFFSFVTVNQETKTVVATYDGFEYDVYNFSVSGGDDETDVYISFKEISESILMEFDLKSDKLVGKNFEITYSIETSEGEEIEEDEMESEEDEEDVSEARYVLESIKRVK